MTALAALVTAVALFAWFGRLERTGRSATVVGVLFAIVLIDAVLYQDQTFAPVGLFHPEYREQSFRLIDVVVPVAVLARLLHRRGHPSGGPAVLLWLAFLLWLTTAGVVGAYEGHPMKIVAFQGKAIIYLGALLVAAGIPIADYVGGRRLERFLTWVAGVALVVSATDAAGIALNLGLPLVPLDGFGVLGSDAATMFSALGVVALATGLLGGAGRRRLLAIAGVLLLTPALAGQRAAFVALALSLAILAVAMLLSRRRVAATPTDALLAAAAVAGLLLLSTVPAVIGNNAVRLPLQDRLSTTFGSYEEVLTTRDRINQWEAAKPLIAEQPIYGHGLGFQYVFWNEGYIVFTKTDLTHNIFVDLLLRAGIVGLALFLLAFGATAATTLRGWLSRRSDINAAFALGIGAAVTGLVGKGMAESIFEKYRLTLALGLGIGAMLSAGLPARPPVAPARSAAGGRRARTAIADADPAATRRQGAPST